MAPKQSDGESVGDGNGTKGLALTRVLEQLAAFWMPGECVVGAACCDLQATTSAIPAQVPVPPTLCLGLMLHTRLTQLHSCHNPHCCPVRHGSSSSPISISCN